MDNFYVIFGSIFVGSALQTGLQCMYKVCSACKQTDLQHMHKVRSACKQTGPQHVHKVLLCTFESHGNAGIVD